MSGRSHALLVSPTEPSQSGSGLALRAWAWVHELSREHQTAVLVVKRGSSSLLVDGASRPLRLPTPPAPPRWQRKLARHFPLTPAACGAALPERLHVDAAALEQEVRAHVPEGFARAVIYGMALDGLSGAIAPLVPSGRMELDLNDLDSTARFSMARARLRDRQLLRAWRSAGTGYCYRRLESRLPGPYSRIWIAAPGDAAVLSRRTGTPVDTFPNRIFQPQHRGWSGPPPETRFLFVGTLAYYPNQDAVRFLALKIVPELRRRLPSPWRVTIIGRGASARLANLLRAIPEVEFLGEVPEVAPYYQTTTAAVVPLRAGSGTKLKVIEALAYRCPVVATTEGISGLAVESGQHLLVADDAESFADACATVAAQPDLAARLSAAGYRLFADQYRLEIA